MIVMAMRSSTITTRWRGAIAPGPPFHRRRHRTEHLHVVAAPANFDAEGVATVDSDLGRDGILQWNEAFRKIGIDSAIEVYQQDEVTGAVATLREAVDAVVCPGPLRARPQPD